MSATTANFAVLLSLVTALSSVLCTCATQSRKPMSRSNLATIEPPDAGKKLTPERWASQCHAILQRMADGIEKPFDWGKVVTPVDFDHFGHREHRVGAQLSSGPPGFDVAIWIAPESDLGLFNGEWQPVRRWGDGSPVDLEEDGLDPQLRYVFASDHIRDAEGRIRGKFNEYVELTDEAAQYNVLSYRYVKEKGNCQARISIGGGKRSEESLQGKTSVEYIKAMSLAFEDAADACLDLGAGLAPAKPFTDEEQPPLCEVESRESARPANAKTGSLPPLVVSVEWPSFRSDKEIEAFPRVVGRTVINVVKPDTGEIISRHKLPLLSDPKWREDSMGRSRLALDEAFPEPGDYLIRFSWPKWGDRSWEQATVVSNSDVEVEVQVGISEHRDFDEQADYPYWLAQLIVIRVRLAAPEVQLLRNWKPDSSGTPEYIIWNASYERIYGIERFNSFCGVLETPNNDRWELIDRGDTAAWWGAVRSILPKQVTRSFEGEHLHPTGSLPAGQYKYKVKYSLLPPVRFGPAYDFETERALIQHCEQFELSDVFVIE